MDIDTYAISSDSILDEGSKLSLVCIFIFFNKMSHIISDVFTEDMITVNGGIEFGSFLVVSREPLGGMRDIQTFDRLSVNCFLLNLLKSHTMILCKPFKILYLHRQHPSWHRRHGLRLMFLQDRHPSKHGMHLDHHPNLRLQTVLHQPWYILHTYHQDWISWEPAVTK